MGKLKYSALIYEGAIIKNTKISNHKEIKQIVSKYEKNTD